ncbi:MAG: ABC transporter permease [Actinobacteria bacterium]|nr:ABC transporter permease [Actinomycetota bacterium]
MVKLFREMKISSRVSAFWLCLMALFAVVGHWIPLPDPREFDIDASAVGPFSPGHLLGTDAGGYDLLSNIVNGARTSLLISIVSVGLGGFIGSVLGILAAYRRGRLDYIINTTFNIMLSIPNLVLGLALVAVLANNADPAIPVNPNRRMFVIIVSLTIVIIPILGRIARGATLTWSNREFVVAARSMGMKDLNIVLRHIVPNVLPAIYAVGFLAVGVVIVAEGALSLLGVGIVDGLSWGAMIARVAGEFEYAPQSMYVPVLVLALTVIACNQIGDFLRGRLDVREGKI